MAWEGMLQLVNFFGGEVGGGGGLESVNFFIL